MTRAIRWLTLAAAVLAPTAEAAPCAGFTDVEDTSAFCASVAWLKNRGVTQGCTATEYCPAQPVTRLAMAAFLNRLGNAVLPPNVLWVAPSGGTHQSVRAAIAEAAANASSTSRWLVKIAPGTYDESPPAPIVAQSILLPAFVAVEGSGPDTVVMSNALDAVFKCNDGASLRNLSVQRVPSSGARGIFNESGACSLDDVHVSTGPPGLRSDVTGILTVRRGSIASLDLGANRGVVANGGTVDLRDVTIALTGGASSYAIEATGQGRVTASGLRVTVGQAFAAAGVHATGNAFVVVEGSSLQASSPGSGTAHAVGVEDAASVTVRTSTLDAIATTPFAAVRSGAGALRIAHSQLLAPTTGAPTCFGNYDALFAAVGC